MKGSEKLQIVIDIDIQMCTCGCCAFFSETDALPAFECFIIKGEWRVVAQVGAEMKCIHASPPYSCSNL